MTTTLERKTGSQTSAPPTVRVGIYCRVSIEDREAQEFTSL